MYGEERWNDEAFEQERQAAVERVQARIDEIVLRRAQARWRGKRSGRDAAAMSDDERVEAALAAVAAPW